MSKAGQILANIINAAPRRPKDEVVPLTFDKAGKVYLLPDGLEAAVDESTSIVVKKPRFPSEREMVNRLRPCAKYDGCYVEKSAGTRRILHYFEIL